MARQLTKDAKTKLMDSPALFAEICIMIGVKPISLSQLVYRNSPWLISHDVVKKLADEMDERIEDILEEAPEKTNKPKIKKSVLKKSSQTV